MDHNNILGAVLAGGKSQRFGEDKSQVKLAGKLLIDHMLTEIIDEFKELLIVSNNKINLLDSISSLIFGLVALFFSSRMILGAKDMYLYQEETMLLAFPIWLPFIPVIASFFLLTICCFYTFAIKINQITGK